MPFKPVKYIIIWSIAFIALCSCKQKESVGNIGGSEIDLDRGRELYDHNCAPCHSYNSQNTEYHPSLHEMVDMDKEILMEMTRVLEVDSLHLAVNRLSREQIDTLRHFLKTYDGIDY